MSAPRDRGGRAGADESSAATATDLLKAGPPPYQLGAGKLNGALGPGDSNAGDLGARLIAQTPGAPATPEGTAAERERPGESASELNRKLTNPVSTLWSLSNQFNNFKLANGHWNSNWNFQPVLSVSLTKD